MTTWRKELQGAFTENGDTWKDIEATTLSDRELNAEFDDDYGGIRGVPFTVWTTKHVYFPACYDGREWVASVSRHPDGEPTRHIGGG